MSVSESNLFWIDLEMSGLDLDRERILEIATVVTTKDLEVIATGPELVIHQPESILSAMDDWNKEHHGASGLTERVRSSKTTSEEAEQLTLAFAKTYCPLGLTPIAGNSVHMDRAFLRRYMPLLDGWFHYRIVDVSTIKELAQRWAPEVFRLRPKKKGDHRALTDVMDSIEELRFYRERLFIAS